MNLAPETEVINMQVQEVVQTGGGTSDIAWLPEVDESGNLSWSRSSTTTPPETQNIKGAQGDPGQDGTNGADGKGIASITKTATSGNVDTYTITYTDSTMQTYTVTNGVNGQDGADGQNGVGIASVSVNENNHLIITKTNGTTQDAGEIDVAVPIDDTTPASNKVYSSEKVEEELLDSETTINTRAFNVTPDMKLSDITSQNPVYLYPNANLAIMEDKAETTHRQVTYKVENGLIYINGTATGGLSTIDINMSVPESLKGCPILMCLEVVSGTTGKFTMKMPVYYNSNGEEKQATCTTSGSTVLGVTVTNIHTKGTIYCSEGITAENAVIRPYLIEETYAERGSASSNKPTATRTLVSTSLSGATGTLRCMSGSFSATVVSKKKYDVLFGKRLVLCGDSVAQGNMGESFGRTIAQNENMAFENHAKSGATLSTYDTNNVISQVQALTADYDYILVEGGINDRGHSVTIGTLTTNFDDALDDSTVIGATEKICKTLIENYPSAKKLFVLIHKVTNSSYVPYSNQDTYFNAIISALEKWCIPYVDLRKFPLCGYNATYASTYFNATNFASYGGLHPNTAGYALGYVDQVTAKMKTL